MKIVLSEYGDTLENKEAKPQNELAGCIGHHSCGSCNTGHLNLSNFSKDNNIIVCSHCGRSYIIPKSIKTYVDLKEYFEKKLAKGIIRLNLLGNDFQPTNQTLTISLDKETYTKEISLRKFKDMLKEQLSKDCYYILEEHNFKEKIFTLIYQNDSDSWLIINHHRNSCLLIQGNEPREGEIVNLHKKDIIGFAGMIFQVKF